MTKIIALSIAMQCGRVSAMEEYETLCYWKWTLNLKCHSCNSDDGKSLYAAIYLFLLIYHPGCLFRELHAQRRRYVSCIHLCH